MQLVTMDAVGGIEKLRDGVLKVEKSRIVFGVKGFLFGELPKTFDEIEIWRVGWKKKKLDTQGRRRCLDEFTALVPRVVEDNGNRKMRRVFGDFAQQLTHTLRIDVARVADADEAVRGGA